MAGQRKYPGTDGARQPLVVSEFTRLPPLWRRAAIMAQCSDAMLRTLAQQAVLQNDMDAMQRVGAETVWRRIQMNAQNGDGHIS